MNEWLKENWKILAAITYISICLCDFIIFPVGNIFVSKYLGIPYVPYVPLTLGSGGFIHLSFGAILGAGAYTQGLANIEEVRNQPDFSAAPFMGMNTNLNGFNMNNPIEIGSELLQPDPILKNPKRGIGTGH